MKFFGEYLVSKNIISNEILVDVLVEQQAALPSLLEVVHKKKLIPIEKILNALAMQTEKQIEFKRALQEQNEWTPSVDLEVKKTLETNRIPIGHLLIKRGATDLITLTKALDDFLSRVEMTPPKQLASDSAVESQGDPKESQAVSNSKVDQSLLEEFLTYLTVSRLDELKNLTDLVSQNHDMSDMVQPLLKEMIVIVHSIKGLLRCVQLVNGEKVMNLFESLLLKSLEEAKKNDVSKIQMVVKTSLEILTELILLRKALAENGSEDLWSSRSELNAKIRQWESLC